MRRIVFLVAGAVAVSSLVMPAAHAAASGAPTITSLTPSVGPTTAGTPVTITGTNLTVDAVVTFGGMPASVTGLLGSTELHVVAPAGDGLVDVSVSTAQGAATAAGAYLYAPVPNVSSVSPTNGPYSGGNIVAIRGSDLETVTEVTFGGVPAPMTFSGAGSLLEVQVPASIEPTATAVDVDIVSGPGGVQRIAQYIYTAQAPSEPRNVEALSGNRRVTVTWDAPASTGGAAITNYTATSTTTDDSCTSISVYSCIVYDLTNGVEYVFEVTAANGVGTSAAVTSNPVTPADVPSRAQNVTAEAGDGTATVTWDAPVSDGGAAITGYTVTSTTTQNFCVTTTLQCTVTGLSNGQPYVFEVVAANTAGDSTPARSPAVTPIGAPGAPVDVSAIADGTTVAVLWGAPQFDGGSPVTNYVVTSTTSDDSCVSTETYCVLRGLTLGVTYAFNVVALSAAGASPVAASNPVTLGTVPSAPQNVTAAAGNASATVTWGGPASDGGSAITGYLVTSVPAAGMCAVPAGSTCTVTGLTNGTSYVFTVSAMNATGNSPAAQSNAVVPVAPPSPPSPPAPPAPPVAAPIPAPPFDVDVTTAGGTAFLVSWEPNSDPAFEAATKYLARATPAEGSGGVGSDCVTFGATSCIIDGLTPGGSYLVTVMAGNANGWSNPGEAVEAVTQPVAMSMQIAGVHTRIDGGQQGVRVAGKSFNLPAGTAVTPWFRFPGQVGYTQGVGIRTIDEAGNFAWKRKTQRRIYVYFEALGGSVKSNSIVIDNQKNTTR